VTDDDDRIPYLRAARVHAAGARDRVAAAVTELEAGPLAGDDPRLVAFAAALVAVAEAHRQLVAELRELGEDDPDDDDHEDEPRWPTSEDFGG
jgi:hypothetical protein